MIGPVHDLRKLDTWSVACVLLEMVMGRSWFNTHWLSTYHNNRELLHRGAAPAAQGSFYGFIGLLQQGATSAMSSAQTAPVRTILHRGLEVQPLRRPSAREMLAACNQTQGQTVAVQAAELVALMCRQS